MILGHSVSDAYGIIQSVDEAVATAMQRSPGQLVGMSYLAITHEADTARSHAKVISLRSNGPSSRIRKRYITGEGGVVTLDVLVSRLGDGQTGHLIGTLSTVEAADEMSGGERQPGARNDREPILYNQMPERLWRRAKELMAINRARNETLGTDLFADHAWTLLLLVYVAEAECRIAKTATIADSLRLPAPTADRWVRALQTRGLIEPMADGVDALQLTRAGIDGVERLLAMSPAVSAV